MRPSSTSPRDLFPGGRFGPPASDEQIGAVEAELGIRLPPQLRVLYFECDGFREDRGNAKYLMSLTDDDVIGSLLRTTQFYWNEWPQYYPNLDFRPFVFFGFASGGEIWAIDWESGSKILCYHHHMEDEFELVGNQIAYVWLNDYGLYPTDA